MRKGRSYAIGALTAISIYHFAVLVAAVWVLYLLNESKGAAFGLPADAAILWGNAILLGFIGSLLFFSRKAYVYLITDRVGRLADEVKASGHAAAGEIDEIVATKFVGYCIYLALRPWAGLVIGPVLVMIVLGGLVTLGTGHAADQGVVSPTGRYFIFVMSFLGGYTSSDMFDYFSSLAGRLLKSESPAESK